MKRTAIVTGASSGIGLETAIQLAANGFDIAAVSLPHEAGVSKLMDAVKSHGRDCNFYPLNLGEVGNHEKTLHDILTDFGSVECLVNNAGVSVMSRGDLLDVSLESYDRCFDVNTRGTFFFTQTVARQMSSVSNSDVYRSIVFITSSNAIAATIERGEYCMSKAALSMACKLFALRLARHGIGVYEIQPGLILTEMTAPSKQKYDDLIAKGMTVEQRWGLPMDVARTVVTMATGLLPYTVAQEVRVDGGLLVTRY